MATRVLFVCMGNICRSPTAEGVFRHLLAAQGGDLTVEVDSAGTHGFHVGRPPDERAMTAAARRGIALGDIRARQVTADDFDRFELILCADQANLAHLARLAPPNCAARIRLLLDYADSEVREVPDPYYGGDKGFEQVLDLVESACEGLIRELRSGHPGQQGRTGRP